MNYEPGEVDYEQARVFGDDILVFRRCPRCGRYLRFTRTSRVIVNGLDEVVRLEGFDCVRCGAITPRWDRMPE